MESESFFFESDKLKSHDVLKLGAEKKGWRERKQPLNRKAHAPWIKLIP